MLRESSDLIDANLARAADLISRFKRVSVDQSYQEERNFNLRENIFDTVSNLKRQLDNLGVTLEVRCDEALQVFGDPGCYAQMHTIAVSNALLHAFDEEDGLEDRVLLIAVETDANRLRIVYQDNGKGLAEAERERVFDPFYTTGRNRGGTGLGLHVFFLLVSRRLDGSVSCNDVDPHGFALRAEIPLRRPPR